MTDSPSTNPDDKAAAPQATTCRHSKRARAACPFIAIGLLAILVGGLVAAATARNPIPNLVWLVAYLVLIVGLAQMAFGLGQALFPEQPAGRMRIALRWLLYNLGNIGVIAGTLAGSFVAVAVGTVLLLVALVLFLLAIQNAERTRWRDGYHALIGVVTIGALVGLILSALS